MSFEYKNPTAAGGTVLSTFNAVTRVSTTGTNFSVFGIGGYMEVWSIDDLIFVVPEGSPSGNINYSGNSIPIKYTLGQTTPFTIPSSIIIESDGISCGRRRLGMLVYVHETNTTYQYQIDDYETLFNGASGSTSEDGTTGQYTVTDSTQGGEDLINAWLDSNVEGISGVTRENARWRIFYGSDITVTSGTYNDVEGTLTFTNTTGGTFNVTGLSSTDTYITGGTYDGSEIELINSIGGTVTITGLTDTYMTGGTYNPTTKTLTFEDTDDTTFSVTGLSAEVVSGVISGDTLTLTKNDNSTVSISGLTSVIENIYNTDGILEGNRLVDLSGNTLTLSGSTGDVVISKLSITGAEYSGNSSEVLALDDNNVVKKYDASILDRIKHESVTGLTTGQTVIDTIPLTFKAAFYNYVIQNSTNYRAGTIQTFWDGTNVVWNDFSTTDVGTTEGVEFEFDISGGEARLIVNLPSSSWNVDVFKQLVG